MMMVVMTFGEGDGRVERLDDAASQCQTHKGQQNQTHDNLLDYFMDGVAATALTTTVFGAASDAGVGGVIGEADASVIAAGSARSSAAVKVPAFLGSFRSVDRPTSFSAPGN